MPANRIRVIDMRDKRELIQSALDSGVHFVQERLTQEQIGDQLAEYLSAGDILLDLAWNLQTTQLLQWCRDHGVRYLNTSIEVWDPYLAQESRPITELTLYHRHMQIRQLIERWGDNQGPTAVLDHGANPGLVSHLTKRGLLQIGAKIVETIAPSERSERLQQAISSQQFNELSRLCGVKVIHVSERDTQKSNRTKGRNEFVNTWSIQGLHEEGIAPAELGWGTHERTLPVDAITHKDGPQNQICLERKGMNTWVQSWCPSGEIRGMVIRHGEAFSISEKLTCLDDVGQAIYRPTVHYAYCPCEDAMASLEELRLQDYNKHEDERILRNDIVSGRDELGCLLMGHDLKAWWIGSLLDINESRRLLPNQNPTTLQVASSVLGALFWIIDHPEQGVNLPDDLPHESVLEIALPYLGPLQSGAVDWSPKRLSNGLAASTAGSNGSKSSTATASLPGGDDPHDLWQFERFLIPQTAEVVTPLG